MPGDKQHHTDKWRSCVEKVMGEGHDESSAAAICTASLQKAGEPIFEAAAAGSDDEKTLLRLLHGQLPVADVREFHLCGALSAAHTEKIDGREYLVVPVVALMEGVIHPVNAATPEYVRAEVLAQAAESWNGKPVTIGHPYRNGTLCSANDPLILESHGVGHLRASKMNGKRLGMEALIDPEKLKKLGQTQLEADLRAKRNVEVSVGAHVITAAASGNYQGKPYVVAWVRTAGDHLALLPGGRGACSLEMGCGTHRAAEAYRVTEQGLEVIPMKETAVVKPSLKAASCGCKTAQCGCEGVKVMEKTTRAELIASLVTDKYSGFKDGDESILEAAADARLEEFRAAADARKTEINERTKLETESRNTAARLKVAEERLRAAEQSPSEEEWLAKAPASIKTLLDARKAEEDAMRASLVAQLKDLGANTEEELKKKSIEELQTLAKYARVEIPDFSGRGIPVERGASQNNESFVPPDPYAAGIKALREKAVN